MTNRDAKLEAGSLSKAGPVADEMMLHNAHLRTLVQALPNTPTESAVFAAVFAKELETLFRDTAYLKAVEALSSFRRADQDYREGRLTPPR